MRALLATIVLSVGALLLPLGASGAPGNSMTIRLLSFTTGQGVWLDRAPKRVASKGDVLWVRDVLRNELPQFGRPKNAVVGSDHATVTFVSQHVTLLKSRIRLPGGTLQVQARGRAGKTSRLSVVGGTGAFAYARGRVYVETLNPSGSCALRIYHLLLP